MKNLLYFALGIIASISIAANLSQEKPLKPISDIEARVSILEQRLQEVESVSQTNQIWVWTCYDYLKLNAALIALGIEAIDSVRKETMYIADYSEVDEIILNRQKFLNTVESDEFKEANFEKFQKKFSELVKNNIKLFKELKTQTK